MYFRGNRRGGTVRTLLKPSLLIIVERNFKGGTSMKRCIDILNQQNLNCNALKNKILFMAYLRYGFSCCISRRNCKRSTFYCKKKRLLRKDIVQHTNAINIFTRFVFNASSLKTPSFMKV